MEFISQSNLCIDVYINGDYIGELVRNPIGYWSGHMSFDHMVIESSEFHQIANKLDELNHAK